MTGTVIQVEIKPMAVYHLPQVVRIEEAAFNSPWSITAFIKELHNSYAHYFVAVKDEQIIGYIGVWTLKNELHITNLAVAADYQRQGTATKLLEFIYSTAEELDIAKVSLEVRISNWSAQKLYLQEGFIKVRIESDYYKDNGEDAVIMLKQL